MSPFLWMIAWAVPGTADIPGWRRLFWRLWVTDNRRPLRVEIVPESDAAAFEAWQPKNESDLYRSAEQTGGDDDGW